MNIAAFLLPLKKKKMPIQQGPRIKSARKFNYQPLKNQGCLSRHTL
jgi:hypothetical protein